MSSLAILRSRTQPRESRLSGAVAVLLEIVEERGEIFGCPFPSTPQPTPSNLQEYVLLLVRKARVPSECESKFNLLNDRTYVKFLWGRAFFWCLRHTLLNHIIKDWRESFTLG